MVKVLKRLKSVESNQRNRCSKQPNPIRSTFQELLLQFNMKPTGNSSKKIKPTCKQSSSFFATEPIRSSSIVPEMPFMNFFIISEELPPRAPTPVTGVGAGTAAGATAGTAAGATTGTAAGVGASMAATEGADVAELSDEMEETVEASELPDSSEDELADSSEDELADSSEDELADSSEDELEASSEEDVPVELSEEVSDPDEPSSVSVSLP